MTGLGLGSICIIYKRLRPSQWRRFICFVMFLTLLPALMSCEMAQNKIQASRAGSEVTSISKITPIAAKPNELVSLTGSNFYEAKNLKVSLELANGERATVPLAITNTTTASFTMPDGAGLGVKDVTLTQGSSQVEVARFNLIVDQADNQLPIVVGDGSTVCSDQQYIDRNGDTKTGTKDCASGVTPPACTQNGSIGCVTTETYKAADLTNLSASSIKSGVTIAGVTGTVTQSPDNCSSNGQQSCVATGTYFAGTNCAADGSNCFLPAYSVPGMQTKKAIDFATIDSSKMLDTLTVSGVTGTVASRGTWNLTQTFPGAGFYSAVTNTPADTSYTGTLFGTAGTAVLKPADCSANNVTGCVTTSTYKSADLTNLSAGNIKSTVTIAGVTGNYPSATSPLDGADTTDDLSNVLASRESQLRSATNFEFFMSDGTRVQAQGDADIVAGNIANGFNIFGQAGGATLSPGNCSTNGQQSCVAAGSYFAGTNCAANGSGCYLPTYALTTQPLRAIDYDNINSNAARIRTSTTLGGVTGTLADCSANGSSGCVATSTYLAGQNRSSWDMTTSFPGAGYYSGTSNTPTVGDIKSGVSIAGVTGQYPSSSFQLTGSSGSDLTTPTFNAQIKSSGTFQYFGSDGVRYTGTGDTDITAANIASGVDIFGATGSLTGAVAPDAWNVRVGVTVNGVTGKLKVNCRNRVSTSSPTLYNYDGAISSIGQTSQTGGSVRDIWDTIDDYNNNQVGVPAGIVASWTSSTDCYGVESGAGDDNVWKDVTTTNGTTASTCAATPANCTMQDKITRLSWSKLQASAAWNTALATCAGLTYNGQTGWRLPTQKELMEAYTHGIRSIPSSYAAASTNWMTEANMNANFWSGSSVSNDTNNAWYVYLANGFSTNGTNAVKVNTYQVVCVR
jgi:hypothetical protein